MQQTPLSVLQKAITLTDRRNQRCYRFCLFIHAVLLTMLGFVMNRFAAVLSGIQTWDCDGCVDFQVWASDWRNGWEQEEAGTGENQHWAAEKTTRPWHWHPLLRRLVSFHIWEACDERSSLYLTYYTFLLFLSPFPSPLCSPGPEFGTEHCIFVGMVTEDFDVSELVDTIAALGRDIEESGRVTATLNL